MRRNCTLLVLWLLACAKANAPSGPQAETEPPPVQASGNAAALDASDAIEARAPATPPEAAVPCSAHPLPGDPCLPAQGTQCGVSHCGVSSPLECTGGAWTLSPPPWGFASSPLEFACAPEDHASSSFCELEAQCCGQTLAQPTGCAIGGCELCPPDEPTEGAPCTLPPSCDDHPGPRVIDCYYPCCCYGGATWAQCTGERWHLTTDCSPK